MKKRIVVAISGASGAILAIRLMEALHQDNDCEVHLIVSEGAESTISQETSYSMDYVKSLADVVHPLYDMAACISSGTFQTHGMVVIPCSMKTLAGVAGGYASNLILRAADVALKERRRLVLVARESPLNLIHIKNMAEVTQAGAIILPPMMTFYNEPKSIEDMTHHMVCKALSALGLDCEGYKRWKDNEYV